MMRSNLTAILLLAWALLCTPRSSHAAESYDNCTGFITSLPAVINTQGTWCLKQDLATAMTSGNAITIGTNNVTIDCNNFKLGGLAAGSGTQTFGILALDRQNLTVRHCNIRGFFLGINIYSATTGGHLIEDNRLESNTYLGIRIQGDGSTVQRNRVFDTGGSTVYTPAVGIASDYNVDILDNTVSGVAARSGGGGYAVGINANPSSAGNVNGNRISGVLADGAAFSYGIQEYGTSRMIMRDNNLIGTAALNSFGMYCGGSNGSAKNNMVSGFSTAWFTCSDDGGNSVRP